MVDDAIAVTLIAVVGVFSRPQQALRSSGIVQHKRIAKRTNQRNAPTASLSLLVEAYGFPVGLNKLRAVQASCNTNGLRKAKLTSLHQEIVDGACAVGKAIDLESKDLCLSEPQVG